MSMIRALNICYTKAVTFFLAGVLALIATPVWSQNVLLLSTYNAESPGISRQGIDNLANEFTVAGATVTRFDTLSTVVPTIPANTYDVVVVASVFAQIHPGAWPVLSTAMGDLVSGVRAANSFIFFVDNCAPCAASNKTGLLSLVQSKGLPGATFGTAYAGEPFATTLNATGAYADSFLSKPTLYGGYFSAFQIPLQGGQTSDNILYYVPTSPGREQQAYTTIVPATSSGAFSRACMMATLDATLLYASSYTANGPVGSIGAAFLNAATGVNGSCALPSVKKTFSPAAVNLGDSSTLTITLSNPATVPAGNTSVTDILPAPLQNAVLVSNTCGGTLAISTTTGTNDTITLTGGTIPAAAAGTPGTCELQLTITWPAGGVAQCIGVPIHNTISPQSGQFTTGLGQALTAADAGIQCPTVPLLQFAIKTVDDANHNGVAEVGELLTYTIALENRGAAAATVAHVIDAVPANTTFVSAAGGGTITTPAVGATGNVDWSTVVVPAATLGGWGTLNLTMVVKVDSPLPAGVTSIGNQAVVDGTPSCADIAPPCEPTVIPTPKPQPAVAVPVSPPLVLLPLALLLLAVAWQVCRQRAPGRTGLG